MTHTGPAATATTEVAERITDAVMAKFREAARSVGHPNPTNAEVRDAFARLFPAPQR